MNQNERNVSMCMEVAGIESVEGLGIGPRVVTDGCQMRDDARLQNGHVIRHAASGCETMGMNAD